MHYRAAMKSIDTDADAVRTRPIWQIVVGALICLSAFGIVVHQLDAKAVWLDEAFTHTQAMRLPRQTLTLAREYGNMWLYYSAARIVLRVGGDTTFALRLPAALFAVLSVALLYRLGARLIDRRAGVAAALLLAFNPFFVEYAQQARSYTALIFFALLATWALIESRAFRRRAWTALYVLAALGMIYAHFVGACVLLAHALWALGRYRQRIVGRGMIVALAFGLGVTPLLYFRSSWIENFSWMPNFEFPMLIETLRLWGGGTLALLALCGIGTALTAFDRRRRAVWLLLALAVLVPFVALIALSGRFVDRYFIAALPPLLLLGAWGLTRTRWMAALLIVALGVSAFGVLRWYDQPPLENWTGVLDTLLTDSQPDDGVLFVAFYTVDPYLYNQRRHPQRARAPTPINSYVNPYVPPLTQFERVWLVLAHDQWSFNQAERARALALLDADFELQSTWAFSGRALPIELRLYKRR